MPPLIPIFFLALCLPWQTYTVQPIVFIVLPGVTHLQVSLSRQFTRTQRISKCFVFHTLLLLFFFHSSKPNFGHVFLRRLNSFVFIARISSVSTFGFSTWIYSMTCSLPSENYVKESVVYTSKALLIVHITFSCKKDEFKRMDDLTGCSENDSIQRQAGAELCQAQTSLS